MSRQVWFVLGFALFVVVLGVVGVDAQGPTGGPRRTTSTLGTAITYQGQLKKNGIPVNSNCTVSFDLYSDQSGTTHVIGPVNGSPNPASVVNGLFTVQVDFGSGVFQGDAVWIKPSVQCTGDGSPTAISSSLTALTPAPYALSLQPGAVVSATLSNDVVSFKNYGTGFALTGYTYGSGYAIYGEGKNSIGVYGYSTNSTGLLGTGVFGSGMTYGVRGYGRDSSSIGVYGEALVPSGKGVSGNGTLYGVYGLGGTYGVRGEGSTAVEGISSSTNGNGVVGTADTGSLAYGVWGKSSSGYAGYFDGNVQVNGTLSTTGPKPFKIDNPLDPANQYLYHYAVESPQVENVYNGTLTLDAKGEAVVNLPAYFSEVNTGDYRYYLTAIGAPMPNLYVAEEIQGNTFKIAGGVAGKKVSWMVYGQRNDPWVQDHPQTDVVAKPQGEAGTFLYPQGYGKTESSSLSNSKSQQMGGQR